jgi:dTDP-4-dehydrorhamnose 3,5-epimerase-like enzyme
MVRVVVSTARAVRRSPRTSARESGRLYVPGKHAHGYEALTDSLFCYLVTEEFDAADPDENTHPWNDPRVADLWSTRSPLLSPRDTAAAS